MTSEPEEKFLSDVHINIPEKIAENNSYVSRFQYVITDKLNVENKPAYDDDDDLIINRETYEVAEIEHYMATAISNVGLQVWRGALLLSDFILSNCQLFWEKTVLELGAGTGLCSIITSRYANKVIVTDYDDKINELAKINIDRNKERIKGTMSVQKLDWFKHESQFDLTNEELKLLEDTSVIIAADVIYNDDLTDAFFKTLERLIDLFPIETIHLAMEKRLNFTIEDLDVSCPAYNHFKTHITSTKWKNIASEEDNNFPQAFDYDRVPQLELWTIKPQNATLNI